MVDETGNFILEHMRKFEKTLGDMRADLYAILCRRMDRLEEPATRIEKRLDMVGHR